MTTAVRDRERAHARFSQGFGRQSEVGVMGRRTGWRPKDTVGDNVAAFFAPSDDELSDDGGYTSSSSASASASVSDDDAANANAAAAAHHAAAKAAAAASAAEAASAAAVAAKAAVAGQYDSYNGGGSGGGRRRGRYGFGRGDDEDGDEYDERAAARQHNRGRRGRDYAADERPAARHAFIASTPGGRRRDDDALLDRPWYQQAAAPPTGQAHRPRAHSAMERAARATRHRNGALRARIVRRVSIGLPTAEERAARAGGGRDDDASDDGGGGGGGGGSDEWFVCSEPFRLDCFGAAGGDGGGEHAAAYRDPLLLSPAVGGGKRRSVAAARRGKAATTTARSLHALQRERALERERERAHARAVAAERKAARAAKKRAASAVSEAAAAADDDAADAERYRDAQPDTPQARSGGSRVPTALRKRARRLEWSPAATGTGDAASGGGAADADGERAAAATKTMLARDAQRAEAINVPDGSVTVDELKLSPDGGAVTARSADAHSMFYVVAGAGVKLSLGRAGRFDAYAARGDHLHAPVNVEYRLVNEHPTKVAHVLRYTVTACR